MIAYIAEKVLKVKQQPLKRNKLIYSSLKMWKCIFELQKKPKVKKEKKNLIFILIAFLFCCYALNNKSNK